MRWGVVIVIILASVLNVQCAEVIGGAFNNKR
eukprot:SAG22_NODE_12810_length_428_cov_1.255319_2_plen_31_part_01